MAQENLTWGGVEMVENRFRLAGWLAIANAIIFPLSVGIGMMQGIINRTAFGYSGPSFGPGDLLMLVFTIFNIYILLMFRKYLHEHFQFHELDILIIIAIIWNVFTMVVATVLKMVVIEYWPVPRMALGITYITFLGVSVVTAGVVDIIFAVKLFKITDMGGGLLKTLAYLTMISGILEVSIIFSPLALLLMPVSFVIYGLLFIRAGEEVEFV